MEFETLATERTAALVVRECPKLRCRPDYRGHHFDRAADECFAEPGFVVVEPAPVIVAVPGKCANIEVRSKPCKPQRHPFPERLAVSDIRESDDFARIDSFRQKERLCVRLAFNEVGADAFEYGDVRTVDEAKVVELDNAFACDDFARDDFDGAREPLHTG
jgi:hypothetical protein